MYSSLAKPVAHCRTLVPIGFLSPSSASVRHRASLMAMATAITVSLHSFALRTPGSFKAGRQEKAETLRPSRPAGPDPRPGSAIHQDAVEVAR